MRLQRSNRGNMKNRDTFSDLHPLVNFLFFAPVLLLTMFLMQPACLAISLISALCYYRSLCGKNAIKFALRGMLPLFLLTALINPLFSHKGATVLWYFPSGNPLTLESILYGLCAACLLTAAMTWFACCTQVMTSDKFVYLFGRVAPALSLVLSMTLRFVPQFCARFRTVSETQRALRGDTATGIWQKLKCASATFSIVVTWALEHAIETADSMHSRGYGLHGRTAFSIYRFTSRDKAVLLWFVLCGIYVAVGTVSGYLDWRCYPTIEGAALTQYSASVYCVYFALCLTPMLLNGKEALAWKRLQSKT